MTLVWYTGKPAASVEWNATRSLRKAGHDLLSTIGTVKQRSCQHTNSTLQIPLYRPVDVANKQKQNKARRLVSQRLLIQNINDACL